jgi:hypothetical protein
MDKEVNQGINLAQFKNQAYMNLETFRKNGEGVKTPVWFVQEGNTFYVRTGEESWKVKRLRHNPQVNIVPSNNSGGPLGEWVPMTAELVKDPSLDQEVNQMFNHKYGMQKRLFDLMGRLRGFNLVTLAISPDVIS